MTQRDAAIDWTRVKRVLVVRLRSIGDTVLATPSLIALKRFLPHAEIDILLEDWVAPLLKGNSAVDRVISMGKGSVARVATAFEIRSRRYDVVFNLHGGTTATFLTRASGAPNRIGYADYQYSLLHNHLFGPSSEFWNRPKTHSAEQQLALLGYAGIPVDDQPKSGLEIVPEAATTVGRRLAAVGLANLPFALIHPAAAFATKQWATVNFARTAEYLAVRGLRAVAVAARHEFPILDELRSASEIPVVTFDDLTLPEITALASRAALFVGNDSGIAHIAAAVCTPSVVVFGSSNRDHWRPWTDASYEIVFREYLCQPCAGYTCEAFGHPRCILDIAPEQVFAAISRVTSAK
jgi:lipopolysaccharide heptosyltransferase II